jgi:hypothetical protein
MVDKISKEARREVLEALRHRYRQASKCEKTRILDEFVALVGCHRKHAVRLLVRQDPVSPVRHGPRRLVYDEAVKEALIIVWESADRICGKRLKAVVPDLVDALDRHGKLNLDSEVRARLLSASAATMDRLLAPIRGAVQGHRKRRVSQTKPSKQIPIRTFADWNEPGPGFLEIDLVAHSGGSMTGAFIHSLVATDICSGWTESVPLLAREQSLVVEGLEAIRRRAPFPVRGIDSDNDSAFINDTLLSYCGLHGIKFTRSRAYHKNDQAWIEEKNGSVIRRFVGYERFAGPVAGQAMAYLYEAVRLYVNHFQPSFKLLEKIRAGAKVQKRYSKPATPCARLLAHPAIEEERKERLRASRAGLDPLALLHRIREAQAALASLGSANPTNGPGRESLDAFLSQLPRLWRAGEVRPTHRKSAPTPRSWRTRKDPFETVWTEILLWLQANPDTPAKSLFERMKRDHPGRFHDGQLRTLQRRVGEWRQVMARQLVHGCLQEEPRALEVVATSAAASG